LSIYREEGTQVLIKNVLSHADDLHDGRPIGPYATAEISDEAAELEHYQSRITDGLMVVVPEPAKSGPKTAPKGAKSASVDAGKETS
jgi:hypothetical protein